MNYKQILYSIFAAFLALGLMYLDTKLLDNPKTKSTYIKGMVMTGFVVWIILYILDCSSKGSSSQFLPGINEEILTGPPEF